MSRKRPRGPLKDLVRCKFYDTPRDMVRLIFGYLGVVDLASVARVCKQWRDISRCNTLWKPFVNAIKRLNPLEITTGNPHEYLLLKQAENMELWKLYRTVILVNGCIWVAGIDFNTWKVTLLHQSSGMSAMRATKGMCVHYIREWYPDGCPMMKKTDINPQTLSKRVRDAHFRNIRNGKDCKCRLDKSL